MPGSRRCAASCRADDLPAARRARRKRRPRRSSRRSGGRVEVVDQLVRRVTLRCASPTISACPSRAEGRLDVWATRLFEFQFAELAEGPRAARAGGRDRPRLPRPHRPRDRPPQGRTGTRRDDVLARCLALQAAGEPGYSDVEIRTALLCMIVGGPPQPPMVVPQAMEQLLRRPEALAAAQAAARRRTTTIALLHASSWRRCASIRSPRACRAIAIRDWTVARGTRRAADDPEGRDGHRGVRLGDDGRAAACPSPRGSTRTGGRTSTSISATSLHECFGRHINGATLHRMLKPLLSRPNLRRAPARGPPDQERTIRGASGRGVRVSIGNPALFSPAPPAPHLGLAIAR